MTFTFMENAIIINYQGHYFYFMYNFLLQFDLAVLYFVNHGMSNSVFDVFFSFITQVKNWMPVYVIGILWLWIKGGKRGRYIALGAVLLILVSDQTGVFLKNVFGRDRPCIALSDLNLPLGKTGSGSFPSNHALNNFAQAVFFTFFFPQAKRILFTVAVLISLSRVYLGLHYPSDIIGGALLGSAIGYGFITVYNVINKRFSIE